LGAPVLIKDIVDALEMLSDEYRSFLNVDSGEVVTVSLELLSEAEEGEEDEEPDLPAWQDDEWEEAKRIASSDRYRRLPTKFDVHEWEIMQDFAFSVKPTRIGEELQRAIHGSGAFRHFKNTVRREGVEKEWFAFRLESFRQIAIDWCEEHDVPWR
jgi:hypothetical protein